VGTAKNYQLPHFCQEEFTMYFKMIFRVRKDRLLPLKLGFDRSPISD
jgi:hypothetical protein